MQYLLLMYFDETWDQLSVTARQQIYEEQLQLTQQLTASGQYLAGAPLHAFMSAQVRKQDLQLFAGIAKLDAVAEAKDVPFRVLVPAFMISELRRAFEIGFLLFLPFLIIDLVVASILMSMGMMMLPSAVISLPFKIVFFVLVDGWYLVAGSLVQSFNGS